MFCVYYYESFLLHLQFFTSCKLFHTSVRFGSKTVRRTDVPIMVYLWGFRMSDTRGFTVELDVDSGKLEPPLSSTIGLTPFVSGFRHIPSPRDPDRVFVKKEGSGDPDIIFPYDTSRDFTGTPEKEYQNL